MASFYNYDKKMEELFADWLDDYFYEELAKNELIMGWYRVNGKKLQKQGKDVVLIMSATEEHIIDEKATLHYINKDIPTFAFEIKNQTSGAEGWLFNEKLITEYYLLAWPNGKNPIDSQFKFTSSKIMLISRTNVIELLREKNLSRETILNNVYKYSKIATKKNNKFKMTDGIYLNFNFSLSEKPINLVIRRELLKKKAIFFDNIDDRETAQIKDFKL